MVEQGRVVNKIIWWKNQQSGYAREIKVLDREIADYEYLGSRAETAINKLEQRLWWLRFIDFCNTPCWRFTL